MNHSKTLRFLLLVSGLAFSATVMPAADKPHPPAASAASPSVTHPAEQPRIAGKIVSLDAKTSVLVVARQAGNVNVTLDPTTTVTLDGKPSTKAELTAGRNATIVTREQNGVTHAVSISLHS